MRRVARFTIAAIVGVHGLIHLLGVVKGFGWADVSQLTKPISAPMGAAWLAATILLTGAALMLAAATPRWWLVSGLAAITSQAVIVTSWTDANAGTGANIVLALAAIYGFLANGPSSSRTVFRRLGDEQQHLAVTSAVTSAPVTRADLSHLPSPVAAYVAASGAIGRPRIVGFRAQIHGRIRGGPDKPWMNWVGEQINTYGPHPSRVFFMDATMRGLPVDVLHVYIGSATMRVKPVSAVTLVDARGPEMDEAETVTLLNDLCVLAPAALVDVPIQWSGIDERRVRAVFSNAGHTVSAELVFDETGELVDFISDDRYRASSDAKTFTRQRWSTPLSNYRDFAGRRIAAYGRGRWHLADPDAAFDYLEFHLDDIQYLNATPTTPATGSAPVGAAVERSDGIDLRVPSLGDRVG